MTLYIRHVDDEKQKIELWLCTDPTKEVEGQICHILLGIFILIKNIIRMPKREARHELSRLARYLVAYVKERSPDEHNPNSLN
ncbi:MAG: hypothetical protein KGI50_00265 [Patescibacteria group bacterium]|nr:hypothetical protein [Patescibacteria group bacterium]MDE2438206.1 hypothetical protein [Patescibacteria group bacterium]